MVRFKAARAADKMAKCFCHGYVGGYNSFLEVFLRILMCLPDVIHLITLS